MESSFPPQLAPIPLFFGAWVLPRTALDLKVSESNLRHLPFYEPILYRISYGTIRDLSDLFLQLHYQQRHLLFLDLRSDFYDSSHCS